MKHLSRWSIGLVVAAAVLGAVGAQAQSYPAKPIRLLIPFAPGGASDIIARVVAQKASVDLGQPVVVESRPGAGGTLAAGLAANSAPDGYTLLFVAAGHAGSGALYPNLSFDPIKDLPPVIGLAKSSIVVVVHTNSKYSTIADLVADAKGRPGKLNFGGGGGGATVTNLAAEVFKKEVAIDVTAIPYRGSGPAMTALMAKETDYSFDAVAAVIGHIRGGKLRALAVTSRERSGVLPDVPAISESLLPGFDAYAWFGILSPRGVPPEIVAKLNGVFNQAIKSPEVLERFRDVGADPLGGPPEAFGRFVESEAARWGKVIRDLGLKAE